MIHVNSDTQEVINMVMKEHSEDRSLMSLIVNYIKFILSLKKYEISDVFHEVNKVTIFIINDALHLKGSYLSILK